MKTPIAAAVAVVLLTFSLSAHSEDQPTRPSDAEPQTITITRDQTGDYRPRFKPNLNAANEKIMKQTNEFRVTEKLEPVSRDDVLQKTAQDFADFMAKTGKYGHNADDRTPGDRAQAQGYQICLIAENIAYQYKSNGFSTEPLVEGFFEGWKNSPPHRANMLQPAVTQTGVAISQSKETGAYFAVQLFGRPMSQALTFQIHNPLGTEISYRLDEESPHQLPPRYTRRHLLCTPATLNLMQNEMVQSSLPVESGMSYSAQLENGKMVWTKSPLPKEPTTP